MKPCIILFDGRYKVYEAFSEIGRLIARRTNYADLLSTLSHYGFASVPLNSRCGRTIHDKLITKTWGETSHD